MNNFNLAKAIEVLQRTPAALQALLEGLSGTWTHSSEGPDTWSPRDVVAHMVHGEDTDWIPRIEIILEHGTARPFTPFDRFAFQRRFRDHSMPELTTLFAEKRAANLQRLMELRIDEDALQRQGIHPEFGEVTLSQLIAAWVVHDLGHIRQIARVMAKQYREAIGPWHVYLPVVHE